MARPRSFDESAALEAALIAFWRYGYEGTSLELLAKLMGMNKASIYRAFNSKTDLFRRVVELYNQDYLAFRHAALEQASPREVASTLLYRMVELHAEGATPAGCLVTSAALTAGPEFDDIRQHLAKERDALWGMLTEKLEEAQRVGPLLSGLSAAETAGLIATVVQGLAVQASSGRSREDMAGVVTSFLSLWPSDKAVADDGGSATERQSQEVATVGA
ncbi:TetR/AcrR family transcriptional regulator [Arthrobacter sp. SLBN-112]|uniref:TetR/AcrR family transcriptional regulator n=1 Tax=Arthrobacter sp. SLBN-112 TaxID=2768452 RepID=UPI0027B58514|nr:TetR/AcrR family transcriptional regulator [Arthrobacter sp. SLBN-112]MDQ0799031.1 AcrR family transcriptional regulator [Arthrobacter sp. SLBN-112]